MSLLDVPPSVIVRQLGQPIHAACTPLVAMLAAGQEMPPVELNCIYRHRNATSVRRLLASLPGAFVRLWSLDEVDAELARWTIGAGPGRRVELLNRLRVDADDSASRWLVIVDDDVRVPPGKLKRFVKLAHQACLDVSQPAHLPRSYASWNFNRQRLFTIVRITRFVEGGPLVLFSPRARRHCLPFPEELGMGWGLEAHFATAASKTLRLGIVDAVGMRHLNPVAGDYSRADAEKTARRAFEAIGPYRHELQLTSDRWPIWRCHAPWV